MTIRRQIAQGYAVVIGIAFAGATIGLLVGSHFQRQALAAQSVATAERNLLSDLQVKILYNRPTKQLSPYLDNWADLRLAIDAMMIRTVEIEALLESRTAIYKAKSRLPLQLLPSDDEKLQQQLNDYVVTLKEFQERLRQFSQAVEPLSSPDGDITKAQKLLIDFVQGPEFASFVQLPKDLVRVVDDVESQQQLASEALEDATALKTRLIIGSLLLSSSVAAAIALYTSRAIARPVLKVTQSAERIVEEGEYSLRIPAQGSGEVKSLANAFNRLVIQVSQLSEQVGQRDADLLLTTGELRQKKIQLVQTEKISTVGQQVADVASELSTPASFIHSNLTRVRLYAQSLIEVVGLFQARYPQQTAAVQSELDNVDLATIQADLPNTLNAMQVGTQRIRKIVSSLHDFSHLDQSAIKRVNIHNGLDSTLSVLQPRLEATAGMPAIAIRKDYERLPLVQCAESDLNQVFLNVLLNAIDALQLESAHPKKYQVLSQLPQITIRTFKTAADWVQIEITDNGPGMSTAIKDRVLDPFFTTKPVGEATGMGLSLCYQTVTKTHKGKMDIVSEPAEGTTVTIQIPCRLLPG